MIEKNFAGLDGFVWWLGVVESRDDPLKLGRCRVRVYGFHTDSLTDIPSADLPWAHPVTPLTSGQFATPREGETVFGFFADGRNAQQPIIMGIVPGIVQHPRDPGAGFGDQRDEQALQHAPRKPQSIAFIKDGSGVQITERDSASHYPLDSQLGKPSIAPTATTEENSVVQTRRENREKNIMTADGVRWDEPYPAYNPRYPYNASTETESGHVIDVDDSPGDERLAAYHRSGTFQEIYPSGTKVEKIVKSRYEIIMADDYVYIMGDVAVTVDKSARVRVLGDCTLEVGNKLKILSSGDLDISATGKLNLKANEINAQALNSMNLHANEMRMGGGAEAHITAGQFNADANEVNFQMKKAATPQGSPASDPPEKPLPNTGQALPEKIPVPPESVRDEGRIITPEQAKAEIEEGMTPEPVEEIAPESPCGFIEAEHTFLSSAQWEMGPDGLAIVKEYEGFRANAYPDPGTGGEPITIGYGTTASAIDRPVTLGMTVSKEQAEEWLRYGIRNKYLPSLKRYVKVNLTQGMIDSLLSFIYNVGPGNFATSTLLKKLNQSDWCGAADEFHRWNKASGRVMPGLIRRRAAERDLFLS